MTTLRFIVFILICPVWLAAQLDQVATLLEADNCTQAIQLVQPSLQKDKDAIAAHTLLARAYANTACAEYDLQKAYTATATAYELYRQLDRKEKDRLEKKYFAPRDLTRLRNDLTEHFLQAARSSGDPAEVQAFLDTYSIARRSLRDEATRLRDSLYLAQAITDGTVAAFAELEQQHGASLRQDVRLARLLDVAEVMAWVNDTGAAAEAELSAQFPDNRVANHPSVDYYQKTVAEDTEQAYRYFLKLYPSSPLAAVVTDSVQAKTAHRIQRERLRDSLVLVLTDTERSVDWPAADTRLAELMQDTRLAMRSVAPLGRIPTELSPQTVATVYAPYQDVGTLEAIRIFQERYPAYATHTLVEADLAAIKEAARQRRRQLVDSLLMAWTAAPLSPTLDEDMQTLEKAIRTMNPTERDATRQRWRALDDRFFTDTELAGEADAYLTTRYALLTERERYAWETKASRTPPTALPELKQNILDRYVALNDLDSLTTFVESFPDPVWKKKADAAADNMRVKQGKTLAGLQKQLRPLLQERRWADALAEAEAAAGQLRENEDYQDLLDILRRDEPEATQELLGNISVNSPEDEYTPVLSADGSTLYYCRQEIFEVLRVATLRDGELTDQGAVPAFVDASENIAPLSLTVDGNRLLLFRGGEMYYSDRTREGWSEPVRYPDAINGGQWQGMGTLSPDGGAMIFEARGRKDMQGSSINNIDLFISFRNADGTWREAINLGAVVNTPHRERSPYLHPDTRTLYFSTDGRSGLGGMDVYKTTRLDDTWLAWSKPVHLGRSANTTGDDWGYKITTNGEYAYFAADPDGDDMDDIYQVRIPLEARPEPVTLFSAFLFDNQQQPLEVELLVEDLETGEVVAKLRSEPGTGKITATLPNDKQYGLVFEDGQRLPFADNLDLRGIDTSQVVTAEINMQTVEEAVESGEEITLRNVFFDHDEATLKASSLPELERVAEFIQRQNELRVEVNGHTDNSGSPTYNQTLSQQRAEAVRAKLVELGVAAASIVAQGYGETRPQTSNDTATGRARNRRVAIELKPQ